MVSFPNAKINLGLNITEKRSDGFHNLESCFYPVNWSDALEILPSEKLLFTSSGTPVPGEPESNLCLKIYHALKKNFDIPPVHIHLLKNIPIGAGMGGGSADAAFTARMLNTLFNLSLTDNQMEDYVRPLGSDCAFFIRNKPVLALEKGDRFKDIPVSLDGLYIIIVYPSIHISTAEAYSGVKPAKPARAAEEILLSDIRAWKDLLKNDFETSLFPKYPVLKEIKSKLYEQGALYSSMTGSGSAIYGIFESEQDLMRLPSWGKCWQGKLD